MRNPTKEILLVGVGILVAGGIVLAQAELTADQILDRMDEASDRVNAGSLIAKVRFDNAYADGTTTYKVFGILARLDGYLIYFLEPEDEKGSIYLVWSYLPLVGAPVEIVSEEERSGSFAGSLLSYEEIGSEDRRADYDVTLIGTEELTIGEMTDADVEDVRMMMWIDSEYFILLKLEGYNELGNLNATMEVRSLGEFEGRLVADQTIVKDVGEESERTITFLGRWRPEEEIPDEVFQADNLPAFDPAIWGLTAED